MSHMLDLLGDGKLIKEVRTAGEGNCPVEGDRVLLHYSCRLAKSAKDDLLDDSRGRGQPFACTLGQGEIIPAWERALLSMREGESASLLVHPELAYGEAGSSGGAVPSSSAGGTSSEDANLFFELELLEVQKCGGVMDADELSPEERLLEASRAKEAGNSSFKAGNWSEASAAYSRGLLLLGIQVPADPHGEDDENAWKDAIRRETRSKLALACHLNMCQCLLRLEDYLLAVQHASAALEMEPGNSKALYRRGLARMGNSQFKKARVDLVEAAKKEPRNAEIREKLQECQNKMQEAVSKEKDDYGGFLDRKGEAAAA